MDKFNLNVQWTLFLERSGLEEESMPADQIREMKRAFYGAVGQLLILMRDDISRLPEAEGVLTLENLLFQVKEFWRNQMKGSDNRKNQTIWELIPVPDAGYINTIRL